MFMGEYHHNIDDKGRLIIPAKFRSELGEKFIITRGLEKCLYVYSETEWNTIVAKLKISYFKFVNKFLFFNHFYAKFLGLFLFLMPCITARKGRTNIRK